MASFKVSKKSSAPVAAASKPLDVSAANLAKWCAAGKPRAWVGAHNGQWNHNDWLKLVEELKKSEYWPMQPEAVGEVLEAMKRTFQTKK